MVELRIPIGGMIDRDCEATVKRVLGEMGGVVVLEVLRGIRTGEVTVDYDPEVVSAERIARALADEGYRPILPPGTP